MSRPVHELLEFDELKKIVSGFSTCAPGRRAVESLSSQYGREVLNAEFSLLSEAIAYLRGGSDFGFGSLADPDSWLSVLAIPASILSIVQLLAAASLTENVYAVRETFRDDSAKHPRLSAQAAALTDFRHLSTRIRRAIAPNGEISDDASPQLKRIRAGLIHAREQIHDSLEGILRARGEASSEDYITLRNERFVIPVRASERRVIPGVVHGASGTGQTVFVEPLATIDLNNRLVQLAEDESAEIGRIVEELTQNLRAERSALEASAAAIAHFDSIFARARFAREFNCSIPEFSEGNSLRLESARNPVLEATLRPQGRKAIPLSLNFGDEKTVMVISGPNTGGKTVALKTVGLAALSAQSGLPIAADHAKLPIFDRVLADIGDEQSIAADLSTFSAHMLNLKSMLETATERSLILVDEMGTGTAPEEGAALAVALLEEFCARRALTLASTHHDRLKAYASTTPGILNAAMELDEAHLRPTYRLLVGVPGTSSGIEIARRLGLPEHIIDRAQNSVSPESRESCELISYLHRSRAEIDEMQRQVGEELAQLQAERQVLRSEWIDRQKKRIAELEKNFLSLNKRFESEISRLVSDIKDRTTRAQLEKQSSHRMRKIASEIRSEADAAVVETLAASQQDLGVAGETPPKPVEPEQLVAGARIIVKGFKQPLIFRRLDAQGAEVAAGPLRMKVPLASIVGIETSEQTSASAPPSSRLRSGSVTVHARPNDDAATHEINVIGCTVEEATRRVDKFLDDAVLARRPSVRIVHGYGTGALRRGLGNFLSEHPLVETIHPEVEDRGGNAITVVELKS